MTTLSINELSPSERRRLGLPESLDRLPPERDKRKLEPQKTFPQRALLKSCWMTWDNETSGSK